MTVEISTAPSMKLLVDTTASRVLFAEAKKDVVDFLFSILALPIGTAMKLLEKEQMGVGSTGNLYASVQKLDVAYLDSAAKGALLGRSSAPPVAPKNGLPIRPRSSVRGGVTYTILDDLTVTPTSAISGLALLNTLGVKDLGALEEKHVQLMHKEALEILRASLSSKSVLTDVFLGKKP